MTTRIGCLHAHYSNIDYIQKAIASDEVELIHYVDPGLMSRIGTDPEFSVAEAGDKVIEQVEWIAKTKVNAILITCTNYIALLDEGRLQTTIPVIKIDEPFFASICEKTERQVLLFTNPATVEGTMDRLYAYSDRANLAIAEVESIVIPNTFELIMQGKKELYDSAVAGFIRDQLAKDRNKSYSVAQLSMVDPAELVERELGVTVGNPLSTLTASLKSARLL